MRFIRRILGLLAVISVLLALAVGVTWYSIHTAWFSNLIRSRIITTLETTTGGRVELGSFTFDAASLHAGISNLVIHGNEPAGRAPFLSVDNTDVGIRILSFWRRDVDVDSIVINHPQIHLMVNADGTTNVPAPKVKAANAIDQFLNLKAKRIKINQGFADINDRQIPFALAAEDIGARIGYQDRGYQVALSVGNVASSYLEKPLPRAKFFYRGKLFGDRLDIEDFHLETEQSSSTLQLAGRVVNFSRPTAHLSVNSVLSIDELARFAGIQAALQDGHIAVKGALDFVSESKKFVFGGTADAHGVAFVSPAFTLRGISASGNLVADNDGLSIKHAYAMARGARFMGNATIKKYRLLQVDGQVSNVALKEVGAYLTQQPFPWSGTAHGQAHASAKLGYAQPELIIGAKVDIDPGIAGIPTAGHVDVTYSNQFNTAEFGESVLNLPHTQASLHGTLDQDLSLQGRTTDLADLQPLIQILGIQILAADLPTFERQGFLHFAGDLKQITSYPVVQGEVSLNHFKLRNYVYDVLKTTFSASASQFSAPQFQLAASGANLNGSASVQLTNWAASANSALQLTARFARLDVVKALALLNYQAPIRKGVASGSAAVDGSLSHPRGNAELSIVNLDAFDQQVSDLQLNAALNNDHLEVRDGKLRSGSAAFLFSGSYQHSPASWLQGEMHIKADSNGFPLSSLAAVRRVLPRLDGRAEIHLDTTGLLRSSNFQPLQMNGTAKVSRIALNGGVLGDVSLTAATEGSAIHFQYGGDLRDVQFHGAARAELTAGTPIRGDLQMDKISLATARSLLSGVKLSLPLDGFLDGHLVFDGPLQDPVRIHAQAVVDHLEVSSTPRPKLAADSAIPEMSLSNKEPIRIDLSNGSLQISKFELDGRDTSLRVGGSIPLRDGMQLDVQAVGNADLGLYMLFDPNARSAGTSDLSAHITGTWDAPNIAGTVKVRNGSFFFADIPNGLSDVDGTVLFSRNRATIQKMTAHSGGGDIVLGGSLSFGEGSSLAYHLEAAARNVRVRYANSISVTANSDLRLSGSSQSSLLSGTLTVTRVVLTPNADAGNLLAAVSANAPAPANPDDLLAGLHLDIGVESAPNLQVSTSLSRDVEAEIQLRLRGTPDHPSVLGNIAANQGDLKVFGTQFTLNRGEVSFVNVVRVEPVLDLDLETQTRGVTVDITVSGTLSKLNFNYRSDPPLQPRDIIALLTVGRAPNVSATSNAQGGSDVSALTSGVNSVLGSAISPVSNRLSKLFGVANIRIDPFVQGITNTPQARLSVEQQISRNVTVTYITNLSQTSEQIFRFEWALSRQFSVVAIRDDNGEFGIDFQYKKRFK